MLRQGEAVGLKAERLQAGDALGVAVAAGGADVAAVGVSGHPVPLQGNRSATVLNTRLYGLIVSAPVGDPVSLLA
ncbi:hypothetical protein D3C85_1425930 [compost metagenome]